MPGDKDKARVSCLSVYPNPPPVRRLIGPPDKLLWIQCLPIGPLRPLPIDNVQQQWQTQLRRPKPGRPMPPSSSSSSGCRCTHQVSLDALSKAVSNRFRSRKRCAADTSVPCLRVERRLPRDRRWSPASKLAARRCGASRRGLPGGRCQRNAALGQRAPAGAEQAAVHVAAAEHHPHGRRRGGCAAAPGGQHLGRGPGVNVAACASPGAVPSAGPPSARDTCHAVCDTAISCPSRLPAAAAQTPPLVQCSQPLPHTPSHPHPNTTQGLWVYPSEQMFYNAMKRKGWSPAEDDMAAVVAIHNSGQ